MLATGGLTKDPTVRVWVEGDDVIPQLQAAMAADAKLQATADAKLQATASAGAETSAVLEQTGVETEETKLSAEKTESATETGAADNTADHADDKDDKEDKGSATATT